jgi:hypothetical protein
VRLHPPLLDNLDAWIAAQAEPRPLRPEAIRRLLALALVSQSAAVKSPSDAFLRAKVRSPGVRLRKSAK